MKHPINYLPIALALIGAAIFLIGGGLELSNVALIGAVIFVSAFFVGHFMFRTKR